MRRRGGWTIVDAAAIGVGGGVAWILFAHGVGEPGLRAMLRFTARAALAFFLLAFVASAAQRLWPNRLTRWLRANRRGLGLSFAIAQVFHGLALLALGPRVSPATLALGGLGFAFALAMAFTSFDAAVAWRGGRPWRLLHGVGAHYLWAVFTFNYAASAPRAPLYALPAAAALAVLGLRLWARRAGRRRAEQPVPAADQGAGQTSPRGTHIDA